MRNLPYVGAVGAFYFLLFNAWPFPSFFLFLYAADAFASCFPHTLLPICRSSFQAARVLVEKGKADLSVCDKSGFQPLHTAISVGDLKTTEALLDLGADIVCRGVKNGNSPCHIAAREGFISVLKMLLERGGEVVLSAKNDAQEVALHRAAAHGQREAVTVLVKAGADVSSRDANGDTPLHLAAMFGMEETAGELISLGAAVDELDEEEQTPLHLAVEAREEAAACALLKRGAMCDLKNEDGFVHRSLVLFCMGPAP